MSIFFPPEVEDIIFRWVVLMQPYRRTDVEVAMSLEVDAPTLQVFSAYQSGHLLQITHLTIGGHFEKDIVPALGWLPALTHVELSIDRYHDLLLESLKIIIETAPRLQSIIIRPEQFYDWCDEYWVQKQFEEWEEVDRRIQVVDTDDKMFVDLWEVSRMQNDRYSTNYICSL
ncbi:hypothetical protein BDQ17DRAFT_1333693 [Cyathus striatus]|nr:hypothetical protein BDQ17DRAFT_1333693 [Cyathus striatus]